MRQIIFVLFMLLSLTVSAQTYSKELEQQAKKGDAKAQCDIGKCYLSGNGVKSDLKKAKK